MIKIISGIVIKWKQLGRTIWYPTVNIKFSWELNDSTYKINIVIDWIVYSWAWTYRKSISIFEWFIFDFSSDVYWKEIEIIILDEIRKNEKVSSLEEVKRLIDEDVRKIKAIKNNVLTFGTFDKLHPWHEYYLNNAKKYSDNLITIVATDENVKKLKWRYPVNNSKNRIKNLKKLNISDEVMLWDEDNPLKWVMIYSPKIICLWYDQTSFSSELEKYINKNNLDIKVIRIAPFKENIYKSSLI